MTFQQAQQLTDSDVINSIINSKYFADYGTVYAISSDGTTATIKHQIQSSFNGQITTIYTPMVEVLYLSSSSISFNTPPSVGDPVLLIGLRRYVPQTGTPMPAPGPAFPAVQAGQSYPSISGNAYDRSTLKAIPLSAINGKSGLIFKADNGKLRLRNITVSLYKILNDIQSACYQGGTPPATLPQVAAYCVALQNAMISIAQEISSLLED